MLRKAARLENLKSKIVEQYRALRTNIHFSSAGNEIKTIVITSCLLGEGKSTVVSNLAITMGKSGKKVVIVDCDLKKPSIHKKFLLSNDQGLTNILSEDKKVEEVLSSTHEENVYVIPSGPISSNSSELLFSENIKDVLSELSNNFDMVLIDTPPVLYISDVQILSALAQGTIIVTAYGKADKKQLLNAKEIIQKAGGKILGVVINKIPNKYCDEYGNSIDYFCGI